MTGLRYVRTYAMSYLSLEIGSTIVRLSRSTCSTSSNDSLRVDLGGHRVVQVEGPQIIRNNNYKSGSALLARLSDKRCRSCIHHSPTEPSASVSRSYSIPRQYTRRPTPLSKSTRDRHTTLRRRLQILQTERRRQCRPTHLQSASVRNDSRFEADVADVPPAIAGEIKPAATGG